MRRLRAWTLAAGAARAQLSDDVVRIGVLTGTTPAESDCPLVWR